jgi:hypothetical protein
MDNEQKNKWLQKLKKAKEKKSDAAKPAGADNPDMNVIRKKYSKSLDAEPVDIPLDPDPSVENDIEIEIKKQHPKPGTDSGEENIESRKVVIKSKSKGTLGSQG